jgi:hypothetical protein
MNNTHNRDMSFSGGGLSAQQDPVRWHRGQLPFVGLLEIWIEISNVFNIV